MSVKIMNTYWEKRRIAKHMSYNDVGKLVGLTGATIINYFTGRYAPTEDVIKKLCKVLNADYEKGRQEFINIYYRYREEYPRFVRAPQTINHETNRNRPKPPPNTTPRAYKDTFWNRLRVSRNLTMKRLAQDLTGNKDCKSYVRISLFNWFSGRNMPPEAWAKKVCDYFDVDYERGISEFQKSHAEWLSARNHREFKYSAKENIQQKTWIFDTETEVLQAIYNKIPYEDFVAFEQNFHKRSYKEAFKNLYGKLDFDTYYQVQASITKFAE